MSLPEIKSDTAGGEKRGDDLVWKAPPGVPSSTSVNSNISKNSRVTFWLFVDRIALIGQELSKFVVVTTRAEKKQ